MAWTTPMTATANTAFTAAQFNTHIRDNLNECAPAKATTAGRWFIASGANSIVERAIDSAEVVTAEGTTSTSYTDLATSGPAVTVTTGTRALVIITAQPEVNTTEAQGYATFAVSSATTIAASDDNCLVETSATTADPYRMSVVRHVTTLNAGSNIFTMKYRTSAGTATFRRRQIIVMGL